MAIMRIGHGFDAHRFGDGDQVTIGGVRIAHTRGLEAHSDGDVLVHAVCDAGADAETVLTDWYTGPLTP